jgi:hypothetical protein
MDTRIEKILAGGEPELVSSPEVDADVIHQLEARLAQF